MTRKLPGVYVSLNDLSTLPEGENNLTVGCVLKANRGRIGVAELVTSPSDFLNKFTFRGYPQPSDDSTFHSILKILAQTNMMYISRAQNGALYGGLVVKREYELGNILAISKSSKAITVAGELAHAVNPGDVVRFNKPSSMAGRYTVSAVQVVPASTGVAARTVLVVEEEPKEDFAGSAEFQFKLILTRAPQPIDQIELCDIESIADIDSLVDGVTVEIPTRKVLVADGDHTLDILVGDRVRLVADDESINYFTVLASNLVEGKTRIAVEEAVADDIATGKLFRNSIATPEGFHFSDEDLFLVTGIDQGAYNGKLGIQIVSYTESPNQLTEDNVFTIGVYDTTTNTQLELPVMCARAQDAKAFDGTNIYVENINDSSAYIKVINNTAVDAELLPCDTVGVSKFGGGFDGKELTQADFINALSVFTDKTVAVSILANGCNPLQETAIYQQAMLELANTRLDCVAFLNNRKVDEQATYNSTKATKIVEYKKGTLGSTSYLGAMYSPHVTVMDTFNSRNVKIGADAIAIAGWLNVLLNKGYPWAYAGPQNGLVTGCTCDWKIGDMSGEATVLNDASVNYVAFDSKVGRYYMQCQNTLQIANSSLRNLGAVMNVLDIKETLATYLKEYLQRPITNRLREEILNSGKAQMELMLSQDRVTGYAFVDTTTDYDLSNNTLRYVLALKLTPYAQQIYLVMNVVNQMFDFSILQSA